jgi:hypothetical protein
MCQPPNRRFNHLEPVMHRKWKGSIDTGGIVEADQGAWQLSLADRVSALETGLGDTGAVGFLHPNESVMLPVLDLDPVL